MSEREFLIAKANRNRKRDASAAAVGVGSVATGAGLVAGGIPGVKDPQSDWGRMKQVKVPRNKAAVKEVSRHAAAAGKGGILGYRVAAHGHELRMADKQNWDVSHHGETTHHGHYGRGVGYGAPHPEKVIIRHMSRGRKIANRTALAGAAATAIGLHNLKGKEMKPRTEAQRSSDRTRDTSTALLAGGGATTAGSAAGGAFLANRGRKWSRYSHAKGLAAEKLAPGIGTTRKLQSYHGTGVPRIRPDIKDEKMHTRPNAFAGTTKQAAERAGALRGQAKKGGYFGRVYGTSGKAVRRIGIPAGLTAVGAGGLIRAKQSYDARKVRKELVEKAYVGGKWVPITAIPKHQLKEMHAAGRVGQKHLRDVDDLSNAIRHQVASSASEMRRSAPTSGHVTNMFTGKKMARTAPGSAKHDMAGPHIAPKSKPGELHAYRGADKQSMKMVRPAAVLQHWGGARFRTGAKGIEAHEHAHGMNRRTGPTMFSSRVQRALENNRDQLSRAAATNPMRSITEHEKLGQAVGRSVQRQGLKEEARADVMATRKLGRTMVSGHVKDTGRAKDYIAARHEIESGMGMKKTKRHQIVYPVAPKHVAAGTAVAGAGGLVEYDRRQNKKRKAKR